MGRDLEVSGKQAGEEPTIRLQPCGKARARFVGPDGQPVARARALDRVRRHARPSDFSQDPRIGASCRPMPRVVQHRPQALPGEARPLTDAEGRITLPALIPGARTGSWTARHPSKGDQVRKEFTVKPGETLDLGDILIEKPSG